MSRRRPTPVWALLFAAALLVSGAPRVARAAEVAIFDPTDCTVIKDPAAVATDPINGTEGDDVICGTPGDDIINGLGGNDTIWGGGGNDTITGGAGTDTIYGEDGNDHLDGGDGDDTEYAGDGDDYLTGGPGADLLFAGDGSDALRGDSGNDTLNGEDGNDQIEGGTGNDTEYGGPGADRLFGGDGRDALLAEAGNDYIDGGTGVDSGSGGDGVDYCTKVTGETISSCFNDASAPKLISIAVSPSSIDTSAGPQKVTVRMRIKDTGAGITGYCDEGAQYSEGGVDCSSWRVQVTFSSSGGQVYFVALENRGCLPTGHKEDYDNGQQVVGSMCRISGTPNDGIYDGTFWVKRYTPRTTFKVVTFVAIDDAGNRTLSMNNLSVSFKQTSIGDGVGPKLISAAFCVPDGSGSCLNTATINTSADAQTVKLRVRIKDVGSGIDVRELSIGTIFPGDSRRSLLIPATNEVRLSGTDNDAIYEYTYVVPKNFPKSTVYLRDFWATDFAGNSTRWEHGDLKAKSLRVSIKQVGVGDATPPAIKSISFSPTSVDVSSQLAWISVTFRIVDATGFLPVRVAGDGYPYDRSLVFGCLGDDCQFGFSVYRGLLESCPTALSQLVGYACRVSGTARDGIYKTSVLIPRNTRKGVLRLKEIQAFDVLGNWTVYTNGGSPSMPPALNKTVTVQ